MRKSEKWVSENMGDMPSDSVLDAAREKMRDKRIANAAQPVAKKRKTPWIVIASACAPVLLLICIVPWLLWGMKSLDGSDALPYSVTENVQVKDFAAEHHMALYDFDFPGQISNLYSDKESAPIGFDTMWDSGEAEGYFTNLTMRLSEQQTEFGLFLNWEPVGTKHTDMTEDFTYSYSEQVINTKVRRVWIEFEHEGNQYHIHARIGESVQDLMREIKLFS